MFIMRQFDRRELVNQPGPVMDAYNKKHAGKRIQVEWGICGVKMQWRVLRNTFRRDRKMFGLTFATCCTMTNFLHRRRKNMRVEVAGTALGGAWGDDDEDSVAPEDDDQTALDDEEEMVRQET